MPPHKTACSPNRSVSHSSRKSVSIIPERPPPMAEQYDLPISRALPEASLSTATKHGTPPPLVYSPRTVCPGPFGAIMITSIPAFGSIKPK